jgi:hypothetical protein
MPITSAALMTFNLLSMSCNQLGLTGGHMDLFFQRNMMNGRQVTQTLRSHQWSNSITTLSKLRSLQMRLKECTSLQSSLHLFIMPRPPDFNHLTYSSDLPASIPSTATIWILKCRSSIQHNLLTRVMSKPSVTSSMQVYPSFSVWKSSMR